MRRLLDALLVTAALLPALRDLRADRRRRRASRALAGPAPAVPTAPPTPGATPTRWLAGVGRTRLLLGLVGVAVIGFGAATMLRTVPWRELLGVALWLAAVVVLHDAVLVPVVSVLRAAAHRAGRGLPDAALGVAKGGFVVGGVVSLVALPAVWAQHLGPANPSVLPGDYGLRLVGVWVVVVVVTALEVLVARRLTAVPGLPGRRA